MVPTSTATTARRNSPSEFANISASGVWSQFVLIAAIFDGRSSVALSFSWRSIGSARIATRRHLVSPIALRMRTCVLGRRGIVEGGGWRGWQSSLPPSGLILRSMVSLPSRLLPPSGGPIRVSWGNWLECWRINTSRKVSSSQSTVSSRLWSRQHPNFHSPKWYTWLCMFCASARRTRLRWLCSSCWRLNRGKKILGLWRSIISGHCLLKMNCRNWKGTLITVWRDTLTRSLSTAWICNAVRH